MIDKSFAEKFSHDWAGAWNSHDLDCVLSHYSDGFEMHSPFIITLANEPSGMLKGKQAVKDYWTKALMMMPDLHFEILSTLVGVSSITIYYRTNKGLAAEVLHLDSNGKVIKAFAHYGL